MSSAEDVAFILNDCKPEVIFYTNTTKDVCEKATAQLSEKIQKINLDEIKIEESKALLHFLNQIQMKLQ